jgi:signal transduction histidine kinase
MRARLVEIEEKAFLQNKNGNINKSHDLLNSDEYLKNKAIYSEGLNTFSLVLNGHIKRKAENSKENIRKKLFLIILSGLLLMVSWILVWASIVSWRKKLFDKNSELEKKMSELEEFSYRTSHDLKAPLVNIRGLSRIMQADLIDGDYEEVSENLQKIGTLSTRLEVLIGDIEETARIDAEQDEAEEVNITQEIEIIKEGLYTLIVDKEIEVITSLNDLKAIFIQKDIILRVLENLISNAIKYSNPKRSNRFVKIEGKALNDKIEILVSDNGLGIPKEFHDEAFGMFKRFHKSDAPGSGLGLYLVKKNLEKINGEISLQSTSEGTTFKITLPILEPTPIDRNLSFNN